MMQLGGLKESCWLINPHFTRLPSDWMERTRDQTSFLLIWHGFFFCVYELHGYREMLAQTLFWFIKKTIVLLTEGSNYANYEVRQSLMLHGELQQLLTRTSSERRTLDAISLTAMAAATATSENWFLMLCFPFPFVLNVLLVFSDQSTFP